MSIILTECLLSGAAVPIPFTYWDQIWHATVDKWFTLTGLIPSGLVYCVAHIEQNTAEI